ncbi:MAG: nitrous oxide reductase accessory protein NosL [Sulfurospirillum sp.]|nr:nitrous oxide reductase accessory protein NosL [Sulfurospirillum sp.]
MKIIILLSFLLQFLFASLDPFLGLDIETHKEQSLKSNLQANQMQRSYASFYSMLLDRVNYGIEDIKIFTQDTRTYEDIATAYLVYGSHVAPSYGKKSLVAFHFEKNANIHVNTKRGKIITYEDLLAQASQILQNNTSFMQKRFQKRAYPMGKKIYEKRCDGRIDPTDFMQLGDLKAFIADELVCGELDAEHLHALSLYLWDVKRKGDLGEVIGQISVEESEKCPVCGMFVYKYPKWAAQIYFQHEDHEHRLSFDGVKDMMKFYFNPLKWGNYTTSQRKNINKILVSDYYSGIGIDGTKAFYVIRSDIYGPMGHEFIPFASFEEATTFKNEHRGKKILSFDQITESMVYELDINQ